MNIYKPSRQTLIRRTRFY